MSWHGSTTGYRNGCRCGDCRQAHTQAAKDERRRIRIEAEDRRTKPTDWMTGAACADINIDLFFPERGDMAASQLARQVCRGCPVREPCLHYAVTEPVETVGVWGGLTAAERRRIVQGRRSA